MSSLVESRLNPRPTRGDHTPNVYISANPGIIRPRMAAVQLELVEVTRDEKNKAVVNLHGE